MKTDSLSTRQLCFILAFFFPIGKLIVLPSALGGVAGGDLLLSAAAVFLLQGAAVFAALWLLQKNQAPVSALIGEKWGQGAGRAYSFLMGAYFLFSAFYPIAEQKTYVLNVMYDTRPSFLVFFPFFLFSCYAAAKGLRCIGRSADLSLFLFPLSFLLLLVMAVGSADFTALLPFAGAGAGAFFKGVSVTFAYCGEAAYLLGFSGYVKTEKGFLWKTMAAYAAGVVGVLVFLAVFYGIFSTVAVREFYALAKVARYYNALKTIGRVDYLFIYAIAVVHLFALVLPVNLSVHAFADCFQTKRYGLISLIVNAVLLLVVFFTNDYFTALNRVITGVLFPVFLLFGFILPYLCPLLTIGKKEKIKEKGDTHVRE